MIFNDITIPDQYKLKVLSNADSTIKKEEINCDFKWETGFKCEQEAFVITGFSISGKILSYNEPVPNIRVYLHNGDVRISDK